MHADGDPDPHRASHHLDPLPSLGEGSRMGSNRQIYHPSSTEACPGPLVSITVPGGMDNHALVCPPTHILIHSYNEYMSKRERERFLTF